MAQVNPSQVQATEAKPVTEVKADQQAQPVEGIKWYRKWWIWFIAAIVIVGAGVGIYYWLA